MRLIKHQNQLHRVPVILIILDGVGIGKKSAENAVYQARTPFLDQLIHTPLYTQLKAHGRAVGMPSDSDMGNSEVGHNTIGAGRVFDQGSALVKAAIKNKTLFQNDTWKKGLNYCNSKKRTLHLIGLLSDGNVHNHIDYQIECINQAIVDGCKKIRLHILLDGRDVEGRSALSYIATLNKVIERHKKNGINIAIASGGGRMVMTMDRYNADWEMVKKGWDTHVLGEGPQVKSAEEAIKLAYSKNENLNDQYIPPFVIAKNGKAIGKIMDGDTVFFTNFRGDRAIELSQAFENETFSRFDRKRFPKVFYAGMLQYDADQNCPKNFLVHPPIIQQCLSEYLCQENIRSFAISETQKYGHVTYFWNGNKSGYVDKSLETFIEIPSDNCPFDEKPAMKAIEITEKVIDLLDSKQYEFGRINFPNGDMVGHTGNMKATIQSIETIDQCTQKIVEKVSKIGGISVICADHGNADEMFSVKNGKKVPKTSHTLNPVPFAIIDSKFNDHYNLRSLKNPGLSNIAATLCNLLGYEHPKEYDPSLIQFKEKT